MKRVPQRFIGVDLHQKSLQMCVVDDRGNILEEKKVTIPLGAAAARVFDAFAPWQAGCRVAVEAVGLNRWFVNGLQERGYAVVVADPVKLNLKILGKKTDKRDARELARRLWLGDIDRDAKTYYPDDQTYGDRKLVRTRQELVQVRQLLTNQIKAMLRAYNLEPPATVLCSQRGIKGLLRMSLATEQQTLCLHELTKLLEKTAQAVKELTKGAEARVAQDPRMQLAMKQLPSMGAISVLTVISELGDAARFRDAKAVASSGGLVPRVSQSADIAHHGRLTKRGNRGLRFILGQWAVRLLATNPVAIGWAQQRRRRLHVNKVKMALARKLLIGVWIMLTRGEVFDLQTCLAA